MKILLIVLLTCFSASAEVNYRNGNYYLEMVEFIIPTGGEALKVKRIYNSRSVNVGAFGFGWSFNFDVKLKVLPGGRIYILDEDGRKILLQARNYKELLKIDIANISKKLKDSSIGKKLNDIDSLEKMSKIFHKNNVEFHIPNNTVYVGHEGWRGYETLKKSKLGWIRTIGHNGLKQLFNNKGQFVKIMDQNGNYLLMTYKGKYLYQISNSYKETVTFEWKRGLISSITSLDSQKFYYVYDKNKLLRKVKHSKFGVTTFDYDKMFNLVKIVYPTGDTKKLSYDDRYDLVTAEKGPGALDVKYTYGVDSRDKKHYWTIISVPFGKTYKEIDRWEYWEDKDKYLRIKDGEKITTKFSKFGSGSPEYIERNGKKTRFYYNNSGQLVKRILPDGTKITTTYNKRIGRPAKVVDGKVTYYYSHDKKGNVIGARDSLGRKVSIKYDSHGMTQLISKKLGKFSFKFNKLGKPVVIYNKKYGKVNIAYDNNANIIDMKAHDKIKDKEHPEVSLVTIKVREMLTEMFGLLKYAISM